MTSPPFGQPITRDLDDGGATTPHDQTTGDPRRRRVFYGTVTPTVVGGLEVGDLWVDLNIPTTKRCTAVGPVTFVDIEGGAVGHDILSATHTDTLAAAVSRGSVLVGNATPEWSELVLGGAATFLRSDATDLLFSAILDADVPGTHSGTAHHLPQTFAIPTGDVDIGDAAAEGASGDATRADHQHAFPAPAASYPLDVAAAEDDGVASTPARSDHVHAHGSGYLPDAHHNQSHSDADHTAGFAAPTGAIDIGDAAAEGVAATHTRSDHQHQNSAPAGGYPLDVAEAEDDGVATTQARADHVHAHGAGYLPDAHHDRSHDHSNALDDVDLNPASLEISGGPFSLQGDISPSIAADQDNWAPAGLADATVIRVTATGAPRTVTGLTGGADGRIILIFNISANNVVLSDENASSDAANRFALGEDLTLSLDEGVQIVYDDTSSRWRALARVESAGGVTFAIPTGTIDIGDAAVEGVSADATRADHVHEYPAPGAGYPLDVAEAEDDGAATTPALSDHVHAHGSGYLPDAHHARSHDHSNTLDSDVLQPLNFDFTAASLLTIVSGDITVTQNFHSIGGEGGADDFLDGIAGGSAGRMLLIRPSDDGDTITVRSNQNPGAANNILLPDGVSIVLDDIEDALLMVFDLTLDTNGAWIKAGDPDSSSFAVPTGDIEIGDAAAEGAAITHSRADHQHQFTAPGASYPLDVAAAEDDGVGTAPARSDHVHAHGSGYLPDAHHGQSHSDSDHTAGFAVPTGAIDIGDAAAEGVATTHSRADHQHQFTAPSGGYPLDVAAAEDDGVASTPARADHVHAHGSGYLPNAHHTDLSKSITIEDPVVGNDISMFFTNKAITVTEMRIVVRGTTPSVTVDVRHGTDRSAAGAALITVPSATTSESTGDDIVAFDDASIIADSFVWIEFDAQSGTVDEVHITIFYTTD